MKKMFRLVGLVVVVLALLSGRPVAGETTFLLVAPAASAASLAEISPIPVRGGKALPFRSVMNGENPRVDAVAAVLAGSPAVREALAWWDLARRTATAPSQGQKWLAADGPIPIWVKPAGTGQKGPGMVSLVPLIIDRSGQSRCQASHLLTLEDLKLPDGTLVTVEEMIAAGLLVPMICHEACHGIMAELYRGMFLVFSTLGTSLGQAHDSPVETDPHLAFREGFAEAGELVLARRFPREFYAAVPATVRPAVAAFAKAIGKNRVRLAGRNRFIFAANGRIRDGKLKAGTTNIATEGVIAALLETLINHAGWREPMPVLFRAMADKTPMTFFSLVSVLLAQTPAQANTIRRILLEYTCYTITSPDAARYYEQYYLSRKAFVQGKLGREEYQMARAAWQLWKDEQRRRLDAGIPVWEAAPEPLVVSARNGFALDLNDTDGERLAWHLESFLPPADSDRIRAQATRLAGQVIARRREVGAFSSLEALRGVLPTWLFSRLEAGRRRHEARLQAQVDDLVTLRRRLDRF